MRKTKFVAEAEIEHLFQDVDLDQTGMIKYSEFLAACLQEHLYLHEDRVVDAFNKLDIDHSGVISRENIKNVLGDELNVRGTTFLSLFLHHHVYHLLCGINKY